MKQARASAGRKGLVSAQGQRHSHGCSSAAPFRTPHARKAVAQARRDTWHENDMHDGSLNPNNPDEEVDVREVVDRIDQESATLRNARLVEALASVLPHNRSKLGRGMLWRLRMSTGFTYTEMFRKYLWYVLKERTFDEAAVEDMVALREAMKLSTTEVAAALHERCFRIERKYGNLMLSTEGLSNRGVQRKATCRTLFSKLLYLVEEPRILPPNDELNVNTMKQIFGGTDEDVKELRIVSLNDADLDAVEHMHSDHDDA